MDHQIDRVTAALGLMDLVGVNDVHISRLKMTGSIFKIAGYFTLDKQQQLHCLRILHLLRNKRYPWRNGMILLL
jgi:hypothetical protein